MRLYHQEPVEARAMFCDAPFLKTRYARSDGEYVLQIGRGENWSVLACKQAYAKAVKTAMELECKSCLFDLNPAQELGFPGLCAAAEGIFGGAYRQRFALDGRWEPEISCYAGGENLSQKELLAACELAHSVIETRNLVNRPSNLLHPVEFAGYLADAMRELPVEAELFMGKDLKQNGLNGLLTVGAGSENEPAMLVLRYTGAPDSTDRFGFVGKGVTVDTGGYCLKSAASMAGIKGDMAGGAAAAMALRALAANRVRVNVTAVIPTCENRISGGSMVPGDVIRLFSGKTVEILNADAEGRLILADALSWAKEKESCTCLVDIATLTGAIYQMLGHVATGVMSNDNAFYNALEAASARSGERFWRMPDFPEYESLIDSDYADVRNTSKDGCGAVTAGLFLKRFVGTRPWLHLDIAGTADNASPLWQHHVPGATGAAVSTLYFLAAEGEK